MLIILVLGILAASKLAVSPDVIKGLISGPKKNNKLLGGLTKEGLKPIITSGGFASSRLNDNAQFVPAECPMMIFGDGISMVSSKSFNCLDISSICNWDF